MKTSQAVIAALKDLSDPTHLEEINALLNSLDDKEAVFVAEKPLPRSPAGKPFGTAPCRG
ncbi:hypothetical protein [Amycolatopsis sp. cmx-11-51]|uniref:hypothetical protein n=1 Tax=unclassified Amycolatopsis TaxID=2618356 RepID=UPI0039E2FD9F